MPTRIAGPFQALAIVIALAAPAAGLSGCGTDSDQPSATVTNELMSRWNAVLPADVRFPFDWRAFDQFPHPMFSGGSDDAYRAFADHLAQFYGAGDNFDFLSQRHLFETRLRYVFSSGQVGVDTTFDEITAYLAKSDSVASTTRQLLESYESRIRGS
jgi:hypothetical protein